MTNTFAFLSFCFLLCHVAAAVTPSPTFSATPAPSTAPSPAPLLSPTPSLTPSPTPVADLPLLAYWFGLDNSFYDNIAKAENIQGFGAFYSTDRKYGSHSLILDPENSVTLYLQTTVNSAFTWSFWIKMDDWDSSTYASAFAYVLRNANNKILFAKLTQNKLQGSFWTDNNAVSTMDLWTPAENASFNQNWVHFAYSQSLTDIRFYRNGQLIHSSTSSEVIGDEVTMILAGTPYGTLSALNLKFDDIRLYSSSVADIQIQTIMCYNGSYWTNESAFTGNCSTCAMGKYSGLEGASQDCIHCAFGSFQNQTGQSFCFSCSAGLSTLFVGSTSDSSCLTTSAPTPGMSYIFIILHITILVSY
jgi:hypothetical protein